ncbi:O-methyltransferase-domain-containing protein [Aspergillus spectabilis]
MSSVSTILEGLATAGKAFDKNEAGSREALIDLGRALVAQLEISSEFLQRTFWAEPAQSAIIRMAVDTKLFQHLKEAGDAGLSGPSLSEKTGIDLVLLQRLARHLVAMYLISYKDGVFLGTTLSNGLAEENYQHSISFCYDTARPSFNGFPAHFKQRDYKSPELGTLDGTPRSSRETDRPFDAQAHDFFTPQPIQHARAYSLHSILHDWRDEDGVKILQNLVPALKKKYSRVLLNEIVVSEEKPNLAATNMDLMMLAHFAVRERTEREWREILKKAGLKIVRVWTYPDTRASPTAIARRLEFPAVSDKGRDSIQH